MTVGGIAADNGPCGCGRWLLHGFRECRSAINLYTYTYPQQILAKVRVLDQNWLI